MKLPARELNMNHLGKTATIRDGGTTITGTIREVSHAADFIDDSNVDEQRFVLGRQWTTITITPGHTVRIPGGEPIEVQE